MPTSAAGNRERRFPENLRGSAAGASHAAASARRPGRTWAAGFTLIELLVVLAIIAIGIAGVSLALPDSNQTALDREAERLAALLESARAQARTSGVLVRWHLTPDGFAFDGLPPGALPTHWLQPGVQAQAQSADGTPLPALQLGPDPIVPAEQVLLSTEGPAPRSLRVATDGLRPFAVQEIVQ